MICDGLCWFSVSGKSGKSGKKINFSCKNTPFSCFWGAAKWMWLSCLAGWLASCLAGCGAGWHAAWLAVAGSCMARCMPGGHPSKRNQDIIIPKNGKSGKSGKKTSFSCKNTWDLATSSYQEKAEKAEKKQALGVKTQLFCVFVSLFPLFPDRTKSTNFTKSTKKLCFYS